MKNNKFYKEIDEKLNNVIEEYDTYFTELKLKKDLDQMKSYAFNILFLEDVGVKKEDIIDSITEGSGDNSADSIFKLKNYKGGYDYYVLQSKWNKISNIRNNSNLEFNGIITEFEEIKKLNNDLFNTKNKKFITKYKELLEHMQNNGKTFFIILALSEINLGTKDKKRKESFKNEFNNILIFDINKLKINFIDKKYKGYHVLNPLLEPKKPREIIKLNPVKLNGGKNEIIKNVAPHHSYVFFVRPKEIFDLFKKYKYSLFQDNIRNPLYSSGINDKIKKTLIDEPNLFWYYNNGITAITDLFPNPINLDHETNKTIEVKGLQIINGGQTFKTIYEYYKDLNDIERENLDNNVMINFRIIKTGGIKTLENNITRYTNLQNKVEERDFFSNDKIQKRLQEDFFINTNIWYETRRGEFVERIPNGDYKIENTKFAQSYLAFYMGFPEKAKSEGKKIFRLKEEGGFYEDIFSANTKYEDLYLGFKLYDYIYFNEKEYKKEYTKINNKIKNRESISLEEKTKLEYDFLLHSTFHICLIFNILDISKLNGLLDKYWNKNYKKDEINIYNKDLYQEYNDIIDKIKIFILKKKEDKTFTLTKYFKSGEATTDLKGLFNIKINATNNSK